MSDDEADVTAEGKQSAGPLLRVVRGTPTAEELAAVVAILSARGGAAEEEPAAPRPRWGAPATAHRRPLPTGPGAWRASALPQ